MLKAYFLNMFRYNYWATIETADSLIASGIKTERAEKLLAHIIAAQEVWIDRTRGTDSAGDPWKFFSPKECKERSSQINVEWTEILDNLNDGDLEKTIEYKNTKGDTFSNSIKDIITHVINHSTYHRAQIAQLIRQSGGEPAKTDYIVYKRKFYK